MKQTHPKNSQAPDPKNKSALDLALLQQLCLIHAPAGNERPLRDFLIRHIQQAAPAWKTKPELIEGEALQDCLIVKLGTPRTAIFAHMDTTGFTVRYNNQLVSIGSPEAEAGTRLVGRDAAGPILCELTFDSDQHAHGKFGRPIDRGTTLTYEVNFKHDRQFIVSPYLDNRLGVYNALQVAETLEHGLLVFTCWEEHGGGSAGYLADYIYRNFGVRQALISDITWASEGVRLGNGVAVSLRDRYIPRKHFIDRVLALAARANVKYQLEVEGTGSSDGGELQRSPVPFDWCFIGAPQQNPHTPNERVHKKDADAMRAMYSFLMKWL